MFFNPKIVYFLVLISCLSVQTFNSYQFSSHKMFISSSFYRILDKLRPKKSGMPVNILPFYNQFQNHTSHFSTYSKFSSQIHKKSNYTSDLDNSNGTKDDKNDLVSYPSIPCKIRQHVNPLSGFYQTPKQFPSHWLETSFANLNQPLILDIGCARGDWVLEYAKLNPLMNVLGLDIRIPIIDICLKRKAQSQLTNVHFLQSNANVDIANILKEFQLKKVPLQMIAIQFPDPFFKKKQHKRRLVQPEFVEMLAQHLPANMLIYIQTDVEALIQDIVGHFFNSPYFINDSRYPLDSFQTNPAYFTNPTNREIGCLQDNLPIYRVMMVRNDVSYQPSSTNNIVESIPSLNE